MKFLPTHHFSTFFKILPTCFLSKLKFSYPNPATFYIISSASFSYKLYLKSGILFIYAEVKGRVNKTTEIYPLPIALRKIQKMQDDCGNYDCIIIWACDDGIVFGRYKELIGTVRYGGRTPRKGSANDLEMMIYYTKQDKLQTHLY